jgi:cation transport ATPase
MSANVPNSTNGVFEELDLMIHDMDTAAQEREVQQVLDGLPGVRAARIIQGGVWLRYNAQSISKEQICAALHRAGYRAGVFQDSKSGAVGRSSQ